MPHRAVLFDLDGTLLDTLEDLADATNQALARLGFPPRPVENFRYYVGNGALNLVRRVLPDDQQDEQTVQNCLEAFGEEYARCWDRKSKPYAGVPELLAALGGRGVPMAVFSNKPDQFAKLCVEKLLPHARFEMVIGAGGDVPHKPDPTGAGLIAERLGIPPGEFLYVGDTGTDMQTASAAGMFPVGVAWGFRPANELVENGAKILIAEPSLLLRLLGMGDA